MSVKWQCAHVTKKTHHLENERELEMGQTEGWMDLSAASLYAPHCM